MKKKMTVLACLIAVLAAPLFAEGQQDAAASYPRRQIQNIFPWSPGAAYAVSQVVAAEMGNQLGKNVVVTSTPGASGVKAAKTMMTKPADGYTIFDGYVAPLILAPLFGNAEYSYKDFKPLYAVASNGFAIAVRRDDVRFDDLPALVDHARQNPGELKYSAGADISLPHMSAAAMLKNSNAVCRFIPYNDTGDGLKELFAGELDFMVVNSGNYKSNTEELRVLAVLSDLEQPGFPGEKLVKDFGISIGLDGLAATGWTWWVVHKDTPDAIVEIMRKAMKTSLDSPKVQKQIRDIGFATLPSDVYSPENYEEQCGKINAQLQAALDAIQWEKDMVKN